jgi:hypothetical protein
MFRSTLLGVTSRVKTKRNRIFFSTSRKAYFSVVQLSSRRDFLLLVLLFYWSFVKNLLLKYAFIYIKFIELNL